MHRLRIHIVQGVVNAQARLLRLRRGRACGRAIARYPISGRAAVAIIALVVLGAAVLAGVQSSNAAAPPGPPQPPAPPAGTQEGPPGSVSPNVVCSKTVTVLITVFQFFSEPTSAGCWGYNRVYQNAGQGMNNWKLCYSSRQPGGAHNVGAGPNNLYNESNPNVPLSTEQNEINGCGNLYAELMHRQTQLASEHWCDSHTTHPKCWRRDHANVVVSRYFAEVYEQETDTDNIYSDWVSGLYGSGPSSDYAMYNIHPIVYSAFHPNDNAPLYNKVLQWCQQTPDGGYLGIYSGAGNPIVQPIDVDTFSAAMDWCTQH